MLCAIAYTAALIRTSRRESREIDEEFAAEYGDQNSAIAERSGAGRMARHVSLLLGGIVIVVVGADWLVDGAVGMARVFGVWSTSMNTGEFQPVQAEMQPKLAAHYDKITQNTALFKRIAAVHNSPAKKKLTPEQIESLRRWVVEGAPWQEHWAYKPASRPAVPGLESVQKPGGSSSIANPIDSFIQAKLPDTGLTPAAEADRVAPV